jgi:hypothetical protein
MKVCEITLLSVSVFPSPVARQRLYKEIPAATNAYTAVEELLDAVFSMWSKSYHVFSMLVLPRTSCLLWKDYAFDKISCATQDAKGSESLFCL